METSLKNIENLTKVGEEYLNAVVSAPCLTETTQASATIACAYFLSALVRIKVKQNYEDKV
jgi:hypothetical protein